MTERRAASPLSDLERATLAVVLAEPFPGYLLLAGFACVVGATAITLLVNVPIDEMMAGWTVATLPADWMQVRDRWETFHTIRTFLTLGGLAATLAGSLLPVEHAEW